MNRLVTTYFGLGILTAIILGILLPSIARSMISISIIFLGILMFLSGIDLKWTNLKHIPEESAIITLSMFCIFFIIPVTIYLFSKLFLSDIHLIYGTVFASLTPVAIVAPFFTDIIAGDKELSFIILLLSMLLCPFIIPVMLVWLIGPLCPVSGWLIFKNMMIIIPLPIFAAYLVKKLFPALNRVLSRNLAILNFISLFFLIFILFGVIVSQLNLTYISFRLLANNISRLLIIAIIQDFGVLFFSWFLLFFLSNRKKRRTLAISFSMKNIAIAAGLLLLFDPRAAIAPAIGFIVHAGLFNTIPALKKFFN